MNFNGDTLPQNQNFELKKLLLNFLKNILIISEKFGYKNFEQKKSYIEKYKILRPIKAQKYRWR